LSCEVIVMTGLDPVIHEHSSNLGRDGWSKSGDDDGGLRDFALPAFIAVRL